MKPEHLNVGLDHLSWVENGDEPTSLEEGLIDVQILAIHITNIIHFLSTGTATEGYSMPQKSELVVWVVDFSVIVGHL